MPADPIPCALVVEDQPAIRRTLMRLLRHEGFMPIAAATCSEAARSCLEHSVAVVVLDRTLPDGDGLDLLPRLRRDVAEDAAIVVVTGQSQPDDLDLALSLGADDFLRKPFAHDELRASIRAVVRLRRAEATARRHAREMGVIARVGSAIACASDLDTALQALLQGGGELASATRGMVRFPSGALPDGAGRIRAYRWGGPGRFAWEDERLDPRSNTARVLATGQGIYAEDLAAEAHAGNALAAHGLARHGVRSSLNVPLRANGAVIGTLHMGALHSHAFRPAHLVPLQVLADYAAAAIERARLQEERDASTAELRSLMAGVRCLLWHAVVTEGPEDLVWDIHVSDEDAAQRLLQLAIAPGQPFVEAWRLSRLPEDFRRINAHAARALRSGEPAYSQDFRCRRGDGSIIWLSEDVRIAPVSPGTWSLIGVCTDSTARKLAEAHVALQYRESERTQSQMRAVLDASVEAMVLLSPDRHFLTVNRRFGELFGVSPAALVGRGIDAIDQQPARAELLRILGDESGADPDDRGRGEAEDPERSRLVVQSWPRERELAVFSTLVQTRKDGPDEECLGRLFVIRDVTREREIDRMKTEFVSLVSHELRTPLTSIGGYVDLLIEGEVGDLTEEQREFLGIVRNNSRRLVALINDLLDVSRIDAGKAELNRTALDFGRVVGDLAASMQPALAAARQTLAVHLPPDLPDVMGDAGRVAQIMSNLVSNAHKYTPHGGHIRVSARAAGDFVRIDVRDTGIGMTNDEQARLFQRFFRAKNRTTQEVGGTGLGLAITRSLVELHGGTITVSSEPGHGSTFSFTLPALARAPRLGTELTSAREPSRREGPSRGKVLVVDDEPDVAGLIQRYLEGDHYDVTVARTGAEAVALAPAIQPDLITLDIVLGDTNGIDLLERLKSNPQTWSIPVMLLSVVEDSGRGKLLGAVDYLVKPVERQDLLARVGAIMGYVRGSGQRRLVMVVDDDPDVRGVLSGFLRRDGYDVVEAGNGDQAISVARSTYPDLALIDVRMPGKDGIDALRELRADTRTSGLPVVMMTASPGHFEASRPVVHALGGAGLLHKPLTAAELAAAIARALSPEEVNA